MVKKIVFFCMGPLMGHHIKVLGEKVLRANGYQVSYYDFSPLAYPVLQKNDILPDRFESKNYILFKENKKAHQAIEELDKECFVVVIGYYQAETFKFYRALSKSNIPYAIKANVTYPFGTGHHGKSWGWKLFSILYRFKIKKLKTIFYKPYLASLFGIRSPDMCILGGKKSLELKILF